MRHQGMIYCTRPHSTTAKALLELLDVQPRRYVSVMEIAQHLDLDRARTIRAMCGAVESGALIQSFVYPNAVYLLPQEFVVIRATQGSRKFIEVWATSFDEQNQEDQDLPLRRTVSAADVPPIERVGHQRMIKLPCLGADHGYTTCTLAPSSVFHLGEMQYANVLLGLKSTEGI